MMLGRYTHAVVEKISRLSDLLLRFGADPLLSGTLSLGGGTALNMLHISPPPRLSEDLDYNYRHLQDRDWGEVRSDVDRSVKDALYALGYTQDQVRIQAYYNLGSFLVHYSTSEDIPDSLKVEIGYMRRMPILRTDARLPFVHPATGERTMVTTAQREEAFANKVCTLVSRKGGRSYPRDLFDVYSISGQEVDTALMVDVFMIDAMMDGLDLAEVTVMPYDPGQVDRLDLMTGAKMDIGTVFDGAARFFERVREMAIHRGWEELSREFRATGRIRLDLLRNPSRINPSIDQHPQLLWVRRPRP
jgi:predicted nucleotidyltransferase component of viral defense system